MARLVAYLTFPGNCREAMEFYRDALGGELTLMEVGGSPMASQIPADMQKNIMHSAVSAEGLTLMASDMLAAEKVVQGNTVTLCITGATRAEIEGLYEKLAAGGTVTTPLNDAFFGTYGDLKDKCGVRWMFQAGNAPS